LFAALAIALVVGVSGCGRTRDPQVAEPPARPAPVGVDFSGTGPYPVGMMSLQLGDRSVAVFYPADEEAAAGAAPVAPYSTLDGLPVDLRGFVPESLVHEIRTTSLYGPPVNDEGPFPLVVYSHDVGTFGRAATTRLEHLASWGIIGAAPDHRNRDFAAALTGEVIIDTEADRQDLGNTIDLMRRENTRVDGVLLGSIDIEHIAVIGHGAGGAAAARLATEDEEIAGWIGHAPSPPSPGGPGRAPFDPVLTAFSLAGTGPPPSPGLFLVADTDVGLSGEVAQVVYDWMAEPKQRMVLRNAGHGTFSDLCPSIRAAGGPDAEDEPLPLPLDVAVLQLDGCAPADVSPAAAGRAIDHLHVAHLRWVFDFDEHRASLAPAFVAERFPDVVAEVGAVSP
jgi:dienelactone hydrolase